MAKSRPFPLLDVSLAVLFAAVLALCVRSLLFTDIVQFESGGAGRPWLLRAASGEVGRFEFLYVRSDAPLGYASVSPIARYFQFADGCFYWRARSESGFGYADFPEWGRFHDARHGYGGWRFRVSWPLVSFCLGTALTVRLVNRRRAELTRRRLQHCCPRCGYDLRA